MTLCSLSLEELSGSVRDIRYVFGQSAAGFVYPNRTWTVTHSQSVSQSVEFGAAAGGRVYCTVTSKSP